MKEFSDESLSFEDKFLQLRFWLIEALHLIADGKMQFTEVTKKNLRFYNSYCKMAGQKPLRVYSSR